jgi:hypothetical protein
MKVRCPHCAFIFDAVEAGTQPCPQCGRSVSVAEPWTSSPPPRAPLAPGVPPLREDTPWERRAELGLFPAFVQTVVAATTRPGPFFAALRPDGPWPDALWYVWLIGVVEGLLGVPFTLLGLQQDSERALRMLDRFGASEQMRQAAEALLSREGGVPAALGATFAAMLVFPFLTLFAAAVTHLFGLLLGCHQGGYWATFRAFAYAWTPLLLLFIPCLGLPVALTYSGYLTVIGLKSVHESTTARAGLTAAGPSLFCCCCCGALLALGGAGMAAGLSRAMGGM